MFINAGKEHESPIQRFVPPDELKSRKTFVVYALIVALAAIPFSLGKYFEFHSPGPFDSGAYVYSAKHILDGAEIGVEEKPSAKLGTLLLNILGVKLFGFSDTGPKIIQMVLQSAALIMMFVTMRRVFGQLAAAVGVVIASVYLSAPVIAKFGNVKEQYMIACMVLGMCCFVMRQLNGKWWWAVLAGGFVSWAPLFKETGTSAIGAIGLFVMLQPLLKHRTWKQTGIDVVLLLAGVLVAIGPLYGWIIGWNVHVELPYQFLWDVFLPTQEGAGLLGSSYLSGARELLPFPEQVPIVMRFYGLLLLPMAMAIGSIVVRIIRMIAGAVSNGQREGASYDRFVLLFAVWWLLDCAFVWISPRSYEQYYLPLNASAAMLGGYLVVVYHDTSKRSAVKMRWTAVGAVALVMMILMAWHIFFGIKESPSSGAVYVSQATGVPEKRNGYLQRYREISWRHQQKTLYAWEAVGEYIRNHSNQDDTMFVWGWYPGIYVAAQRLAPTSWPFTSEMHTKTPERFVLDIRALLEELELHKPRYIVDSRKRHFPNDRPPLELWPVTRNRLLPDDEQVIARFDAEYTRMLRSRFGDAEAGRYNAMKLLRDFVRKNYHPLRSFGMHILFELKDLAADKELPS